jgi:hypothetical protein
MKHKEVLVTLRNTIKWPTAYPLVHEMGDAHFLTHEKKL